MHKGQGARARCCCFCSVLVSRTESGGFSIGGATKSYGVIIPDKEMKYPYWRVLEVLWARKVRCCVLLVPGPPRLHRAEEDLRAYSGGPRGQESVDHLRRLEISNSFLLPLRHMYSLFRRGFPKMNRFKYLGIFRDGTRPAGLLPNISNTNIVIRLKFG